MIRFIIPAIAILAMMSLADAQPMVPSGGGGGGGGSSTITAGTTATSGFTNGDLISSSGNLATDSGILASSLNQAANNLLVGNGATGPTGIATANSGVLVTSAGGVPSVSTTLPSGLTIPGYAPLASPTFTGVTKTAAGSACTAGNLGLVIGTDTYGFWQQTNGFEICVAGLRKLDYGITNAGAWTLGVGDLKSSQGTVIANTGATIQGNQLVAASINYATGYFLAQGTSTPIVNIKRGANFGYTSGDANGGTQDAILTSPGAANWQFGAANVNGSPVAQTISFQGALAGSATNQAGANALIVGSLGTGTGGSGKILLEVGLTGSTGMTQNAAFPLVTLNPNGATTSTVQLGDGTNITTYDSCTALTTGATGIVACTASAIRFKELYAPQPLNLKRLESLRTDVPWKYREGAGHGLDTTRIHIGLFADEVAQLDPRCAVYDADGPKDYEDRCVIAYLTEGYKRVRADNDNLRAEVEALRGSVAR